jgi:hypothetical protein
MTYWKEFYKYMNRVLLYGLFIAVASLCRAEVVLSVDPTSQTVALGTQVNFDLDISGLGSGTALGTYDLNLNFDPTLLSYDNIVFGDQVDISGLGDIQFVTPGSGAIDVFELSLDSAGDLDSLQASAFTLATLTFDTLAAGTDSPVTLSTNALGDAFGNSIIADLENASVSITSLSDTPEPGTLGLLCAGLLALMVVPGIQRRIRWSS